MVYEHKKFDRCFKKDNGDDYYCQIDMKEQGVGEKINNDGQNMNNEKMAELGACRDSCPKYVGKYNGKQN